MDKADKFWTWRFVLLLVILLVAIIVIYVLKVETLHVTYSTYSTPTAQQTTQPTFAPTAQPTPQPTAEPQPIKIVSLGEFRYTYYTNSYEDCKKTDGITFSGVRAVEGITIAADLSVLPMGSWVYIESVGIRKVQDIGSAVRGNLIDIYVDEKSDKLAGLGQVYLLGGVK